jgi:hypothetical protein
VGLVRIEVVIIAVVGVEVLIWVDSSVISPGGKIDTVFVSLVCTLFVACRGAMALTIYKIEDRPHRSSNRRLTPKQQSWLLCGLISVNGIVCQHP